MMKYNMVIFFIFVVLSFSIIIVWGQETDNLVHGTLKSITNLHYAEVGDVVRIDANFENIGEETVSAMFIGEIYYDYKLTKSVKSDEFYVTGGGSMNLSAYFTPDAPGDYYIRGYVIYSGRKSNIKTSYLPVKEASKSEMRLVSNNLAVPLAVDSLLALIVIILVLALRRKSTGGTS